MARSKNKKYPHYEDVARELKGKIPTSVTHSNFDGNTATHMRRTLKIRTTPVTIGIPMDELMFSMFLSNLICLSIMPWDNFVTTQNTLVQDARNSIHDLYLEKSEAPYLFMVDSDVLPPPDAIERLMSHNKPMVGGFYRKKEKFRVKSLGGEVRVVQRPVVYDYNGFNETTKMHVYNERLDEGHGLERVDGMGAGCWLIKREVCEKVGKSPYSFDGGGEDLTFCRKVTTAGYDIFVDWDCPAAHSGVFFV
jgi:hypothetical protein